MGYFTPPTTLCGTVTNPNALTVGPQLNQPVTQSLTQSSIANGAQIYTLFPGSKQFVKAIFQSERLRTSPRPVVNPLSDPAPRANQDTPIPQDDTELPDSRVGNKLSLTFDPTLRRLLDLPANW